MWSSFRHDSQNTGFSQYCGPHNNHLIWSINISSPILSNYSNTSVPVEKYDTNLSENGISSTPIIDKYGTVYISGNNGMVKSIYSSGSLKWNYVMDSPGISSPVIREDMSIISVSRQGYVYAISEYGKQLWNFSFSSVASDLSFQVLVFSSPTVSNDGSIYIGTYGYGFYSLTQNGSLKWRYYIPESSNKSDESNIESKRSAYYSSISSTSSGLPIKNVINTPSFISTFSVLNYLLISLDHTFRMFSSCLSTFLSNIISTPYGLSNKSTLKSSLEPTDNLDNLLTTKSNLKITKISSTEPSIVTLNQIALLNTTLADLTSFIPSAYSGINESNMALTIFSMDTSQPIHHSDTISGTNTSNYSSTLYRNSKNLTPFLDKFNLTYSMPDNCFFDTPVIGSDGSIYVSSAAQFLAFHPSGSVLWSNDYYFAVYSSAVLVSGSIYTQVENGLVAINSSSGTILWKTMCGDKTQINIRNTVVSSPAIGKSGQIYTTSLDTKLYSIYPNGTISWSIHLPDVYESSPAVDANDNIYINFNDGYLRSYSNQGSFRWQYKTNNSASDLSYFTSSPSIGHKLLYVGSSDGKLFAFGYNSDSTQQMQSNNDSNDSNLNTLLIIMISSVLSVLVCFFVIYFLLNLRKRSKVNVQRGDIAEQWLTVEPAIIRVYPRIGIGLWTNDGVLMPGPETVSSNTVNVSDKNYLYPINDQNLNAISYDSYESDLNIGNYIHTSASISRKSSEIIWTVHSYFGSTDSQVYMYESSAGGSATGSRTSSVAGSSTDLSIPKGSSESINMVKIEGMHYSLPSPRIQKTQSHHQFRRENCISWDDIYVTERYSHAAIIGHGTFGIVVKASWRPPDAHHLPDYDTSIKGVPVAVKVMTKTLSGIEDDNRLLVRACKEVAVALDAEQRIGSTRNILKMYGVAAGPLPLIIALFLRLEEEEDAVGIVMRHEKGGSLNNYLYGSKDDNYKGKNPHSIRVTTYIPLETKIHIIYEIAKGITDIHRAGVVHADLKPDNILLSSSIVKYPFVRLADFGLSTIKLSARRDSNYRTSLGMTGRLKGTPVYCAPEMLINPFNESGLIDRVARPSRKTDMYAFGLLAWEILCEEIPFKAVLSETALCSKVHQGARPDLNLLPTEIPPQIRDMISACWDRDRTVRKSAEECLNILKDFLPIDRSN